MSRNKPNPYRYKVQMMARKDLRIADGFVLCENDENPASESSFAIGWFGCGACIYGRSSEIDPAEFIPAPEARNV